MSANYLYQVLQLQALSRYVTQLTLTPASSAILSYQAGQYLKVIYDHDISPLSIANAPSDLSKIELHLSHTPQNQRAQDLLRIAQEEKQLQFRGPYGSCTTNRLLLHFPIIFFVRGTGFAPVKAILEELLLKKSVCPPLHLYWGASSSEDLYLENLAKSWEKQFSSFRYTPVHSRRVESEKLHQAVLLDYPNLSGYQLYVSGPEEMTYLALEMFTKHGLDREFFYSDIFDYDHEG